MKEIHPQGDIFTAEELGKLLKTLPKDIKVAMAFNGCDNNTRTISSVMVTTLEEYFDENDQIVVLFSDRTHL